MEKRNNSRLKYLLLFILIAMLYLPFIQQYFKLVERVELNGAIVQTKPKKLTLKSWFDGTYQAENEKYINENFGFRNHLIRLHNQFAFSVFKRAKANGVVVGKENYLFEIGYINAYYGKDFIGTEKITSKIQQLRFVQDTLSKLNKSIIFVIAAGKGSYYPEYFPDRCHQKKGITNYQVYKQQLQAYDINHIDFNAFFVSNKKTAKFPLYPQYGIHWSHYGMFLAADSMIKYIEGIQKIDMPNLYYKDVIISQPKETDYDIASGMNILSTLKSFDMAYPNVLLEKDFEKTKPSVLVVADSFYWGMFNFGISNAFSKSHFWYYNREVYPDSYERPLQTNQVNVTEEIRKHDVFIIMATESNLVDAGWGFIEKLYQHFKKWFNFVSM